MGPTVGAVTSIILGLLSLGGLMVFLTSPNTASIVGAVFDGFGGAFKTAVGK